MAKKPIISRKILGIDPGTNLLGYAILHIEGKNLSIQTIGVLNLQKFDDHQTKLKEIFLQLQEIIETYLPHSMAIEAPFFGKNVQSMLKLGRAQGVSMAAAMTMGLDICEYAPKKIKVAVTGNGNASKEQVSAMLDQILKVKINAKHLDATDALAVALCHHYQSGRGVATKKYKDWSSYIKNNPSKKR